MGDITVVEDIANITVQDIKNQVGTGLLDPLIIVEIAKRGVGSQFSEELFDLRQHKRIKYLLDRIELAKRDFIKSIFDDNMIIETIKVMDGSGTE